MKSGRTLEQLATELTRQRDAKKDYIAPLSKISMVVEESTESNTEGTEARVFNRAALKLEGAEVLPVSEIAHGQIAEFASIPKNYYDRMRSDSPALLSDNVNHWLRKEGGQRMVRTLDGKARAFLSDKYARFDNFDLAEVALPALMQSGAIVESCEVTERRLYIKAVTERIAFDIKPGDTVQAGIVISNSEIGFGTLSIEPLIYRLVCTNGLIVNSARHRRTHLGKRADTFEGVTEFFTDETRNADQRAYWLKLRDFMNGMFSSFGFEQFVRKFGETVDMPITGNPEKVVEMAQEKLGLTEGERSGVLLHLLQGGDLNKFGLINAITRHAQDVESYDRSTELERIGGKVIDLSAADWQEIAIAA